MDGPRVLTESEWRGMNPRGPIQDSGAPAPVFPVRVVNMLLAEPLGNPRASASGGVFTTAGIGTPSTFSAAPGTNVDFPRNVLYQLSVSGGSAVSASFGGSAIISGSDLRGSSLTEAIALSSIVGQGTDGVVGSKAFGSIGTIHISGYSLGSAYSSRSASISFYFGVGNRLGLPQYVERTNAVQNAWLAAAIQNGSFTVVTGDVGDAAIAMGNAVGTASQILIHRWVTR